MATLFVVPAQYSFVIRDGVCRTATHQIRKSTGGRAEPGAGKNPWLAARQEPRLPEYRVILPQEMAA